MSRRSRLVLPLIATASMLVAFTGLILISGEPERQSPAGLLRLCRDLEGVQRSGCVTAASVIGPVNPLAQLRICWELQRAQDVKSCIQGVKVPNLIDAPQTSRLALIRRCTLFPGEIRTFCYEWLGKGFAVITNGAFASGGCPKLETAEARQACRRGGARMNEALVTFS